MVRGNLRPGATELELGGDFLVSEGSGFTSDDSESGLLFELELAWF
jgi:hypothetical protein